MNRSLKLKCLSLFVVVLAGLWALPVEAGASEANTKRLGLGGYSPVSYFTKGYAEKGDPAFAVEHDGLSYWLADAGQVEAFKTEPQKYVPAYGGWCAFGMSVQDKFPVDPSAFKIVNGRLLLFLRNEGIDARELWNKGDAQELSRKADAHWKKVSG